MRAEKHPITGENEIYLNEEETDDMKEMIECAKLPMKRKFYKLLELL